MSGYLSYLVGGYHAGSGGYHGYQSQAGETEEEKSKAGYQILFNAASAGWAVGSPLSFSGSIPISALLFELKLGASLFGKALGANVDKTRQQGANLTELKENYASGGYQEQNGMMVPKPGPVVDKIDFNEQKITFGDTRYYNSQPPGTFENKPKIDFNPDHARSLREKLGFPKEAAFSPRDGQVVWLPMQPESFLKPDWNLDEPIFASHSGPQLDELRKLEEPGGFQVRYYAFPSPFIVTKMEPSYQPKTIKVNLDEKDRTLAVHDLPKEFKNLISYNLEGRGGKYDIYVNDGVTFNLSEHPQLNGKPSQWVLHTDFIKNQDIKIKGNTLWIGEARINIDPPNAKITIVNDRADAFEVQNNKISVVSVGGGHYADVPQLRTHLAELKKNGWLSDSPVKVTDVTVSSKDHAVLYDPKSETFRLDGETTPVVDADITITPSRERMQTLALQEQADENARRIDDARNRLVESGKAPTSAQVHTYWAGYKQDYRNYLRDRYEADLREVKQSSPPLSPAAQAMADDLVGDPSGVPTSTRVTRLGVNGYSSDDILVLARSDSDIRVLYVPGGHPPFREFPNAAALKDWVAGEARAWSLGDYKNDTSGPIPELLKHFSQYMRRDGNGPFGTTGVENALHHIGRRDGSWRAENINTEDFSVKPNTWDNLADLRAQSDETDANDGKNILQRPLVSFYGTSNGFNRKLSQSSPPLSTYARLQPNQMPYPKTFWDGAKEVWDLVT